MFETQENLYLYITLGTYSDAKAWQGFATTLYMCKSWVLWETGSNQEVSVQNSGERDLFWLGGEISLADVMISIYLEEVDILNIHT